MPTALMLGMRIFDARAVGSGALPNPMNNEVSQVVTVITVALVVMAAVNALLIT